MTRLVFLFAVLGACGKSSNSVDSGSGACTGGTGCGEPCEVGNEVGVGVYCTAGGGECKTAPFLFCTKDFVADAPGYCTGPCSKDSDCGTNAYCSGSGMGGRGCETMLCGGMPSVDAGVDSM